MWVSGKLVKHTRITNRISSQDSRARRWIKKREKILNYTDTATRTNQRYTKLHWLSWPRTQGYPRMWDKTWPTMGQPVARGPFRSFSLPLFILISLPLLGSPGLALCLSFRLLKRCLVPMTSWTLARSYCSSYLAIGIIYWVYQLPYCRRTRTATSWYPGRPLAQTNTVIHCSLLYLLQYDTKFSVNSSLLRLYFILSR